MSGSWGAPHDRSWWERWRRDAIRTSRGTRVEVLRLALSRRRRTAVRRSSGNWMFEGATRFFKNVGSAQGESDAAPAPGVDDGPSGRGVLPPMAPALLSGQRDHTIKRCGTLATGALIAPRGARRYRSVRWRARPDGKHAVLSGRRHLEANTIQGSLGTQSALGAGSRTSRATNTGHRWTFPAGRPPACCRAAMTAT